jgi:hypothetical protein
MKKSLYGEHNQKGRARLEESEKIFGAVIMVVDILCREHQERPKSEYEDVHLLCECIARMFPGHLVAQHGYVHLLAARKDVNRFENPDALMRHGMEVTVFFKKEHIEPKLGYLRTFPHSWLVHKESETIIEPLPLGAVMGIDYPVRHLKNLFQPAFNADPKHELVRGKIPSETRVKSLWTRLEAWVKESNVSFAIC